MTTVAEGRALTSACNGVTRAFNCPYFIAAGDLRVYLLDDPNVANALGTELFEGADYALTGSGRAGTAQITTTVAYPVGKYVRRWRYTSRDQAADYVPNDGFPADSHELQLDRLTLVDEELTGDAASLESRALRVPVGETIAEAPPAPGRKGKIFGWSTISGLIEFLSYQSLANIIAPLLNVNFQGVPGPGTDLSTHADTYAVGNGITDDTAAFAAAALVAQAGTGRLRLGAKSYSISQFVIPEGVYVETAGLKTVLLQRPGQPIATPLVKIIGKNSGIDTFLGVGNIATDASEFQNIVQVVCDATTGDLTNIRIGDIFGQDVRGDVVLVYRHPSGYAAGYDLSGVKIGRITGDNIFRNAVTLAGVSDVKVAGVDCTRVGLYSLAIEPDVGCGPSTGYDIGPIKGHWVIAAPSAAADFIDGVRFHSLDLNPAHATNSLPAYPPPTRFGAFTTRNAKSVTVGSLRAEGHPGAGYKPIYNPGELADQAVHIASLDMKAMCTDVAETAWVWGAGDPIKITIDHVNVDMGASVNEVLFRGINLGNIGAVEAKGTGGFRLIYGCADCEVGPVKVPAHAGNVLVLSSDRIVINGGSFSGDNVFSFSNDCQARALTATATGGVDVGGNHNWLFGGSVGGTSIGSHFYTGGALLLSVDLSGNLTGGNLTGGNVNATATVQVAGTQVLDTRKAPIANPAGGVTVDAEARAAIISILGAMRTGTGHGLIGV